MRPSCRALCAVAVAGTQLGCVGLWGVGRVTEQDAAAISSPSCRLPTFDGSVDAQGSISCPTGYVFAYSEDASEVTCCPTDVDAGAFLEGGPTPR